METGWMGRMASVVGWRRKMMKRMGASVAVEVAFEETRLALELEAVNRRGKRVGGGDAGGDSGGCRRRMWWWRSEW